MSEQGLIFDVQRFSVHDGPGIRTTVFFKGCPLRCRWCQNPEGLRPHIEESGDGLSTLGRLVTADELMGEILRDVPFYRSSGGGVTLSGGEPTAQLPFVTRVARACGTHHLSVGLQTAGTFRWEDFEPLLPLFTFIHYDLKAVDPALHRSLTRSPNRNVLENARRLVSLGAPVIFRRPIVPGLNDGEAELDQLVGFLSELGVRALVLLTYHRSGESKLERLGHPLDPLQIPGGANARRALEQASERLHRAGVEVTA